MLLNRFTAGQACSRLFYCSPRVFGCFTVGQRCWLFYCRSRMLDSFTVGQGCCWIVLL